jgi:hypothetical protein
MASANLLRLRSVRRPQDARDLIRDAPLRLVAEIAIIVAQGGPGTAVAAPSPAADPQDGDSGLIFGRGREGPHPGPLIRRAQVELVALRTRP